MRHRTEYSLEDREGSELQLGKSLLAVLPRKLYSVRLPV